MLSMAITSPTDESHFILCPLKLMGISWCPGCGLGHSIIYLLHGDVAGSFNAHWLGIPATAVILNRIFVLTRSRLQEGKQFRSAV
ncbi:DUF2752 domain-containing protein [Mucilaginibacter celer]|uniref:DUF2752 domain-containing protein n=2 Tax=Mucilaginibacter celer TaxID=2305508 RepID=A0A494W6Y4_9SPHI|nr:DUF2752 domain-containing protein [Mucilaginibacter celer]